MGEDKTPDALRNASDQFFEYQKPEAENAKVGTAKKSKKRPKALIAAVSLMAAESAEGWVGLGALGQYMRRTDPGFSPQKNGYGGLLEMVESYPGLTTRRDGGGHWVQVKEKAE